MKKMITILVITMVTIVGCSVEEKIKENIDKHHTFNGGPIMKFDKYKGFNIGDVISLKIIKYTEAGVEEKEITDLNEIKSYYEMLSKYKVVGTTNLSCDDNTTVYKFILKNGEDMSFEFECEWLVIGNSRYEVENVN